MSKHEARASLLAASASMGVGSSDRDVSPYFQSYAGGGYHEREGIYNTTQQRIDAKSPALLYIPHTKWTWLFFAVNLIQAIICLAIECYVFARFQTDLVGDPNSYKFTKSVPTYLSLFIFGFVYQLLLVYDALRLKNTIQVIGLCIYNVGLLIEAAVQYDQIRDALRYSGIPHDEQNHLIKPEFWHQVKPWVIAMPCVLALGTALMGFIAWKLYEEFAWSIYKNISADLKLKRRYLSYQIYIALLKFDFFFFLAFTVQFIVVVIGTHDSEFYLTIAAIPITIILLMLAAFWTRHENRLGMIVVIVVYFAAMAYFVFKLIRMYEPGYEQDYVAAVHSLTTFAAITIILLVVTIAYAFICMANFNTGLKPHLMGTSMGHSLSHRGQRQSVDLTKMYTNDLPLANHAQHRMTID